MIGPADIVIEVVSPESVARDYGEKYQEYEKAKVKEYWIIDPIREETRFNRLNDKGIFVTVLPDANGYYETPLLPGLRVHVPTLWEDSLPDIMAIVDSVTRMLNKEK